MSDELIAVSLLWLFVFIYAMAASIDFGAGFWALMYLYRKENNMTTIANRYLSPSWEVTNVFIVLVVVGMVSFFPGATGTLGTVLLLPFSIGLLLLTVRSAFLVFSHAAEKRYARTLSVISGATGIFLPMLLILVLPITYGDVIGVSGGTEHLLWGALLSSPSTYAYLAFAGLSTLFLSSLLLADYSHVSEDWRAYKVYRKDAIWMAPFAFLAAISVLVTMRGDAPWMYENLSAHKGWILGSGVLYLLGYLALFAPKKAGMPANGRPRLAVVATIFQYLLAATGYGMAHLPYIVYPTVTIESGFTDESTFHALFASYLVGFAILTPGFWLFWRMFMRDKKYLRQK
ncbi:cytochrome d ubiquinol oxidase subunit II [Tumebacillus sp. ITR2]|uniref:Cytochrome d ubiquinol oxidase subunit II n=1 Tax=Tumebacillus amylolyticus TaxID=2801339 RepID=A0ABS1J4I9_9BACL|nr:cytochrome d ubiquinol oxidase subunit II [Tumebacillus amylolyticus]MBL0385197.1 cytochrome d ubiquinol oxidase subunit II [Tumebacillus amylolyticus]